MQRQRNVRIQGRCLRFRILDTPISSRMNWECALSISVLVGAVKICIPAAGKDNHSENVDCDMNDSIESIRTGTSAF